MVVSAYVDAKAHSIQTQVLGGLDKFARAEEANHGDLLIRADGQRTPRPLQFATAAAFSASGLAIAGAGAALAGLPGAIAGGALGLPLDGMFAPAQLDLSPRELASSFVDQASSLTPSFAAWDCEQFQSRLLPALDKLGHHLAHNVDRSQVKAALVRASSPDWLPSGRVDLGTFLAALPQEPLAQEAREAFRASLVNTQNEKTLTFHLSRERDDDSLPEGWREFLRAADFAVKPHWLTAPFC